MGWKSAGGGVKRTHAYSIHGGEGPIFPDFCVGPTSTKWMAPGDIIINDSVCLCSFQSVSLYACIAVRLLLAAIVCVYFFL